MKPVTDFTAFFPFWGGLSEAQQKTIRDCCRVEHYKKESLICESAAGGKGLLLVQKGALRVYIVSREGRELNLYRVEQGDVCVLSGSGLMEEIDVDVLVEAMVDTEAVVVSAADLRPLMDDNGDLALFLYKKTALRFNCVMQILQKVMFDRIDQRIARFLLEESRHRGQNCVLSTHDAIACEIGSAREVVSKTLKHMAQNGILRIQHGKIDILEVEALRRIAEGQA